MLEPPSLESVLELAVGHSKFTELSQLHKCVLLCSQSCDLGIEFHAQPDERRGA